MKKQIISQLNPSDQVTNQDLHQFLSIYLNHLLLHRQCSTNLLLPSYPQQGETGKLQNLYSFLNEITSTELVPSSIQSSIKKMDSQKKNNNSLVICEEEKMVCLSESAKGKSHPNMLATLEELTIKGLIERERQEMDRRQSFC